MIIERLYTKVLLPGGSKEVSELDDKQLKNLSKYGETEKDRKNIRKSGIKLAVSSGAVGGLIGSLTGSVKNVSKGMVTGLGIGTGLSLYGHHRNKKLAKEAKEELARRNNKNNK